jgi:hypothetical protein
MAILSQQQLVCARSTHVHSLLVILSKDHPAIGILIGQVQAGAGAIHTELDSLGAELASLGESIAATKPPPPEKPEPPELRGAEAMAVAAIPVMPDRSLTKTAGWKTP